MNKSVASMVSATAVAPSSSESLDKDVAPVSAFRQVMLLARKEIEAGFFSKAYRVFALIVAIVVFLIPLVPRVIGDVFAGDKKIAVIGTAEDRNMLLGMNLLPRDATYEALDRMPEDQKKYDLIINASVYPVALKTEKLSQASKFQGLVPAMQLYQERRQLNRAGITMAPLLPVEIGYDRDDAEEVSRVVVSVLISVMMLMALFAFAAAVAQGVFADKNNRVVDVLYPKTSGLRLLAGKIVGLGIFGWVQLLVLGLIAVASVALFTDMDWPQLVLQPVIFSLIWLIFAYLLLAFIVAALVSTVRNAEGMAIATLPVYLFGFLAYGSGMAAVGDVSAPWVWQLGLFPPFSATLIPMQAAAGSLSAGYAVLSITVSVAIVAVCAFISARVYKRFILGRTTRV